MPTDPLRLAALAATAVADAALGDDWQEGERLIKRGHRAAYLAGLAERLGVPLDSALLSEQRLSRVERREVDRLIDEQLAYWRKFDAAHDELSDEAIAARAAMYGRATRKTYYEARWGDWDIPSELMPCNQSCLSNCRCSIDITDHGDGRGTLTRSMGAERHCTECPALAGDHPIKRRGA